MTGEKPHARDLQPGDRTPAPGDLALVQAFLNTRWDLTTPDHGETLVSPAALHDWLEASGLIGERDRLDAGDLDRTLAIREGLRALAFANNELQPDPRAVNAMRQASQGAATEIRIEPQGPRFVAAAATPIDAAIGAVFAITARAMIDGTWKRFKACPGRRCGWVFYDHSRNLSARWCSMQVCGNREKARAYYQRKTGMDQ